MGAAVFKDMFVSVRGGFGGGASSRSSAAVNNATYSGGSVSSASGSSIGSTVVSGATVLKIYNAADLLSSVAGGVSSDLSYYTPEELKAMNESERAVAEQNESLQKVVEAQSKKVDEVKQKTDEIASGITYEQGQSLPSVLSQNAKSLTLAINSLTAAFTEQFALLNNYMMGNLVYQQQFLDIKTEESGLKIDAMQYNKTAQTVYDLDGNALGKTVPRDLAVQKDAVVGIDYTDKVNFSLDNDGDFDDIVNGVDITSIFGYTSDADVVKEAFTRLGGVGL